MSEAQRKIRKFISDPKASLKHLHQEYGLDRKEFSKVLIITSTALLFVSVHAAETMGSIKKDLSQTENQVQEASAVINSDSFQRALNSLKRVQSNRLSRQLEIAQKSFIQAERSFDNISSAQNKVEQSYKTYQWMSLISILGIVSGVSLRFM